MYNVESQIYSGLRAGRFNCAYSLYVCGYFSPVGASVFAWVFLFARDLP